MVDYQLYELTPQQFEKLVCDLCHEILGTATISFSDGPDGGRDAKFEGKSNNFPSKEGCWEGKFVIQAKRKASAIAKCSDKDFKKEIEEESNKVKKLKDKSLVENYIVFTSRAQSADSDEKLLDSIRKISTLSNVALIGKETITRYLIKHEEVAKRHNLNKFREPLRFNSEQVKLIVEAFHSAKDSIEEDKIQEIFSQKFITKEEKNKLNDLSKEYFEEIQKESLPYFKNIDKFLENPRNIKFRDYYNDITNELKFKIAARRNEFDKFDEIFSYLYDIILNENQDLAEKGIRRLIHTLLHYMYWHCDIGKDVETN